MIKTLFLMIDSLGLFFFLVIVTESWTSTAKGKKLWDMGSCYLVSFAHVPADMILLGWGCWSVTCAATHQQGVFKIFQLRGLRGSHVIHLNTHTHSTEREQRNSKETQAYFGLSACFLQLSKRHSAWISFPPPCGNPQT